MPVSCSEPSKRSWLNLISHQQLCPAAQLQSNTECESAAVQLVTGCLRPFFSLKDISSSRTKA